MITLQVTARASQVRRTRVFDKSFGATAKDEVCGVE